MGSGADLRTCLTLIFPLSSHDMATFVMRLLCILTLLYIDKILSYACTLHSNSQQENNSISIYAFVLILCMFTMYVCCISFVFIEQNMLKLIICILLLDMEVGKQSVNILIRCCVIRRLIRAFTSAFVRSNDARCTRETHYVMAFITPPTNVLGFSTLCETQISTPSLSNGTKNLTY